MSLSGHSRLALCLVLFGALAPSGAPAQTNNTQYEWKPFLPPVLPLPSNTQVTPGSLSPAPIPGNPAPTINNAEIPRAPGLTITIPTR